MFLWCSYGVVLHILWCSYGVVYTILWCSYGVVSIGPAQSWGAWQCSRSQPRPPTTCRSSIVVIIIRILNSSNNTITVSVQLCTTGVPRIFTANSSTPDDWVEPRMRWSAPLQRKAVVFKITQPLCHESWTLAA